ncbi:hypothetical protein DQ384_09930 [Sphaerisporangium album]|uniref:HAF repeat-containing protein n=1 Tax=Sphaerisporangium album TaxID=509200 RepID=A0A367FQF1_9ACTN|nr:hypothetical protein [Sphaerisporangium album]RCG31835.1 hypothetical protein DQ384_09930 [Sphaerisporangium album]
MTRRRTTLALLAASGLTAATLTAPPVAAQARATATTYTYVNLGWLGIPSTGQAISGAYDVNAQRQVTGYSSNSQNPAAHAFRWQNGVMSPIPAIYTTGENTGEAINDLGHVVGHTHVSRYEPAHAYVQRNGTITDLGTGWGSGSGSSASDINNNGVVVGLHFQSQGSPYRAALWQNGNLRDLGTLGGSSTQRWSTESEAHAVNDKGQVVGVALPATGFPLHGFLWQNGRMTDIGTLGGNGEATEPQDINEKTEVTGWSQNAAGATHAFLWDAQGMRDLGALPGGTGSFAYGINESGQVVGTSRTSASYYGQHAFLWKDGQMIDLNSVVTNLPADIALEQALAINDEGVIVGQTCYYCEPGKTARPHAYMLIPNG